MPTSRLDLQGGAWKYIPTYWYDNLHIEAYVPSYLQRLISRKAVQQRGIRLVRMDCSSAYSAKSAERLGFTCMYSAKYTDIKLDGRPLIVPETPHVDDRVYIKALYEK